MKIEVTQEDIESGVPGSACECPIALAIRRTTGRNVFVDKVELTFEGGASYDLPDKACDFILDFDAKSKVEPFVFEINTKR